MNSKPYFAYVGTKGISRRNFFEEGDREEFFVLE